MRFPAFGFIAGQEIKAAGVGNIGLEDRKSSPSISTGNTLVRRLGLKRQSEQQRTPSTPANAASQAPVRPARPAKRTSMLWL